jgi:hypothetical protein
VLVTVLAATLVVLHGLVLATERGRAERTLRAVLPVLLDLDQALASHPNAIRAAADAGTDRVAIPGLPLALAVPRSEALAGGEQLRDAALGEAARTLYAHGPGVFRAPDAGREPTTDLFTSQWAVRRALGLMTDGAHDRLAQARLVMLVLTAGALGFLLLALESERWLLGTGGALVAAAILAAVMLGAGRLLVWLMVSGTGAVVGAVVSRIAHDTLLAAGLIAVVLAGAGIVLMIAGTVMPKAPRGRAVSPGRGVRRVQRGSIEPWEDV